MGEEEEREDTEEHPACSLNQHLQVINFRRQKIAEQAESGIPEGGRHYLISQETHVLHASHPGAQCHKRTDLPSQV
jgi:hypothetical protein